MKTYCNLCSMMLLTFFALVLSMGSLQAQTKPNCDLTKCSPAERAACAKRCASTAMATTAGLTDLLFATTSEKPACKPAACAKAKTATAKLVSTETKNAPTYTNSLDAVVVEKLMDTDKQKNCAMKCSKKKTSL